VVIRDEVYKFFADYIYKITGMVYLPSEYYRLDSRINELVKVFSLNSVDELYALYLKDITPDMKAVLVNISTNNETYFFRDVKPFTLLSRVVLPEVLTNFPNEEIKIWSSACSSGQEAYSMLMSIRNTADDASFNRCRIDGSDISEKALEKAKSGIYNGLEIQRGLPAALIIKYFSQLNDDSWSIDTTLKAKTNFFEFNLFTGVYPQEKYHIIFCRNILIYQDNENKGKILNSIYNSLKKDGILVLGAGESLIGIVAPFQQIQFDGYTVYKKDSKG